MRFYRPDALIPTNRFICQIHSNVLSSNQLRRSTEGVSFMTSAKKISSKSVHDIQFIHSSCSQTDRQTDRPERITSTAEVVIIIIISSSNIPCCCEELGSVVVRPLDLQSTGRGFNSPAAALPSSDPGQVVHTCPAPLKLRPYGAMQI